MTATAETPHPRDVFDYKDGSGAEQAFLDAQARGRLHHAWLLCGPEGVGKATFAYRAVPLLKKPSSSAAALDRSMMRPP